MPRSWLYAAGLLVLMVAWFAPRSRPEPFSLHMTVHMSIVALAAPLLALGIAGSAADPVRMAPRLFSPVLASVIELAVVWLWHTPLLHRAAAAEPAVYCAEQASFLLAGLFLWISAFGQHESPQRAGEGLIALLLTAMHMTLLGALIALSPRVLYAHHSHAHALDDQQLGGAIMILAGGISYIAGGLALARRILRHRELQSSVSR